MIHHAESLPLLPLFSSSAFLEATLKYVLRVLKPSLILTVARVYKHTSVPRRGDRPLVPRPEFVSERKSPTASQDESVATTDNPMTELLRTITKNLEEVDQHLADRDKRIGDLRQERKSGGHNTHIAVRGEAKHTPPGNHAPPLSERDQAPRSVPTEVESP